MKTLDDALLTPGVIPNGVYDLNGYARVEIVRGSNGAVFLTGHLLPSELRRIADHLDPQISPAEAKREAEARDDIEFGHFLDQTIALDRVRAEARREALEEAIRAIPKGWDVGNGSNTRVVMPEEVAATIRALIEKEPGNGDTP